MVAMLVAVLPLKSSLRIAANLKGESLKIDVFREIREFW